MRQPKEALAKFVSTDRLAFTNPDSVRFVGASSIVVVCCA